MHKLIKVQDHDGLLKDLGSGAILNTDKSAILRHEKRMREIEKEKSRDAEINNIKSDLSEIKALIKALLDKG